MTRIFVYEYLSGGGSGGDQATNDDLLSMGQSMRDAIVADLLGLDNCEVSVAACDHAKAPIGPARSVTPQDGETPFDFVARQAQANDLVWVVAPETEGVLTLLAQRVEPTRWLGCDGDSIRLASSKHATLLRLADAGVTTSLAFEHAPEVTQWVVKPDDGAGSLDTRVHASFEAATRDRANRLLHAGCATTIEPWVDGQALSLSLLCGAQHTELLSINRQHLSIDADGSVSFCGVVVNALPLDDPRAAALRDLAASVGAAIAGLRGFVGVDLVWHAQRGPVVIEVNPRVTCAYVGLSSALGRNVAADIIAAHQSSTSKAGRPQMATPERDVFGWDIGGAHVKACRLQRGEVAEVIDAVQWACPLWQGMDQLAAVLRAAHARWPGLGAAQHAVTMTGEMVDLFANREDGVRRIAAEFVQLLLADSADSSPPAAVHFYAGDAGWCASAEVATHWEAIASANWLATARHAALCTAKNGRNHDHDDGILVDIGSTTTDLIAFKRGRVLTTSRTDAQRLASGELVYHGVVRTPLCALAPRIDWRGVPHNVMNEFFATTADVYRLTGELSTAHDLHPSADNAPKDTLATCQRLARMIGLDQRDAAASNWLDFARSWRAAQIAELAGQLQRVMAAHGLCRNAVVVSAGCGDFLVADVLAKARGGDGGGGGSGEVVAYGCDIARVSAHARPSRRVIQTWAQVCAPSVAVAALFDQDHR